MTIESGMRKKNFDYRIKNGLVEVNDLSFIDGGSNYSWLKLHYRHHRLRLALKRANTIIARNPEVARDLIKYYFVPKERIKINVPDIQE